MSTESKQLAERFAAAKVVVVDDEHYMRKVVRTMLLSIGVRHVYEAPDGPAGLDLIRRVAPDVVILDWQMPGLDGPGFVHMLSLIHISEGARFLRPRLFQGTGGR